MPSGEPDYLPPTYMHLLDYHRTLGDEVADLCVAAGFIPDPEQRLVLDQVFAFNKRGKSVAKEVAIICPRQNLKTGTMLQIGLGWLFVTEEPLVVWTAHEFSTAAESFRDITNIIEANPFLDAEVKRIWRGEGNEAVELKNGSRLKFRSRTKAGGRGLASDKLFLDEGFALADVHMGAIVPIMSARPDSQMIYGSSSGLQSSSVLRRLRERGRKGDGSRLAYFEWSDPKPDTCEVDGCDHELGVKGCALDDLDRVASVNPQFGKRITVEAILTERESMPPMEFARERLGWWDDPADDTDAATLAEWLAAEDTDAEPTGRLSFAVDAAPAHTYATIVVCGGGVLEVVDRKRGTQWLPQRLAELRDAHNVEHFVIDPAGPIGALIPELERAEVPLLLLNGRDSVNACTAIEVAIREGEAKHRGEPELMNAVGGAKRRKVGDGWKWTRADSTVDISPLVAATYAWWGAVGFDNDPSEPSIHFI